MRISDELVDKYIPRYIRWLKYLEQEEARLQSKIDVLEAANARRAGALSYFGKMGTATEESPRGGPAPMNVNKRAAAGEASAGMAGKTKSSYFATKLEEMDTPTRMQPVSAEILEETGDGESIADAQEPKAGNPVQTRSEAPIQAAKSNPQPIAPGVPVPAALVPSAAIPVAAAVAAATEVDLGALGDKWESVAEDLSDTWEELAQQTKETPVPAPETPVPAPESAAIEELSDTWEVEGEGGNVAEEEPDEEEVLGAFFAERPMFSLPDLNSLGSEEGDEDTGVEEPDVDADATDDMESVDDTDSGIGDNDDAGEEEHTGEEDEAAAGGNKGARTLTEYLRGRFGIEMGD